jgi:hypothetical protein
MKLLNDDYAQIYVWVDDHNEDLELSPHFDYEEDAIQWRDRMKKELNDKNNSSTL